MPTIDPIAALSDRINDNIGGPVGGKSQVNWNVNVTINNKVGQTRSENLSTVKVGTSTLESTKVGRN